MVAGSIAGCVEHMAMFPVDTVRTRMQVLESCPIKSVGVRSAIRSILRSDGPARLDCGIAAMALGAGPAHAVYFSVYEFCNKSLSHGNPNNPFAHALFGICATVMSDAVFTTRLKLSGGGGNETYRGMRDCVVRVLREEGLGAFYSSYRTTVVMNAPMHFATYEAVKRGLSEVSPENVSDEWLVVHTTTGAAAGALASVVTTPLDVVKTQLQCHVS